MAITVVDGIAYDGDFNGATPHGPPTIIFPLQSKGDTTTRMVRQPFYIPSARYRGPVLDSAWPYPDVIPARSMKLVEHTEPTIAAGPIAIYDAVWSDFPQQRVDAEPFVYTYQYIKIQAGTGRKLLGEVTITVPSQIYVTYVHTRNPIEITIKRAQKYIRYPDDAVLSFGNKYSKKGGWRLAEDTNYSRWYGNFWEIRERYVPDLQLRETFV